MLRLVSTWHETLQLMLSDFPVFRNTSVEDYYRDLNSISRYDGLFYLNNFSNLFSSGMTLFELMIVNNWHVIMEGYAAVTGSAWSRCYFMAFYLVTMVVLTITVSLFLEAFLFRIQYKRTVGSDLGKSPDSFPFQ